MQQLCSCYTLHPCYYLSASYDASAERKIMHNCKLPSHPLSCTGYDFLLTQWGEHSVSGIKTSWTEINIHYPLRWEVYNLEWVLAFSRNIVYESLAQSLQKRWWAPLDALKKYIEYPDAVYPCITFCVFVSRHGTDIRGGADGAITYSCCSQ